MLRSQVSSSMAGALQHLPGRGLLTESPHLSASFCLYKIITGFSLFRHPVKISLERNNNQKELVVICSSVFKYFVEK